MPFQTRNSYYLSISASAVLPLSVYLDEQHVSWMTDRVLQHVLADLKPKIIPKMRAEADVQLGVGAASSSAKKGTVDVHRGDTYQFAYFFRQTEPHAVLIKHRNFVLDTRPPPPVAPPQSSASSKTKGKSRKRSATASKASSSTAGKKRKTQPKKKVTEEEELPSGGEDEDEDIGDGAVDIAAPAPRKSSRVKKAIASYAEDDGEDIEMADGAASADSLNETADDAGTKPGPADVLLPAETEGDAPPYIAEETETAGLPVVKDEDPEPTLDASTGPVPTPNPQAIIEIEDDEEPKPKLTLQLKYRGFSISGRCLCVVVEPWPPQRSASRAPSLAPVVSTTVRAPSIAPADFRPSGGEAGRRAKTPLFLPEFDRAGSEAPGPSRFKTLPPVPLFNDLAPDDDEPDFDMEDEYGENTALMQFSQIINSTGGGGGGVEDDDEFDGAVFFADADEAREL